MTQDTQERINRAATVLERLPSRHRNYFLDAIIGLDEVMATEAQPIEVPAEHRAAFEQGRADIRAGRIAEPDAVEKIFARYR